VEFKFRDKERSMRGDFRVQIYRRGRLIEAYHDHNLIVDGARDAMARLIMEDVAGKRITHIALGTNGAAPTPDDTAITGTFVKVISGFSYPVPGQAEITWNLSVSEANGLAIIEFGLICADGTLFARKIRENSKPIYKEDDISIDGQWTIIF
jgi:hypothetical protein